MFAEFSTLLSNLVKDADKVIKKLDDSSTKSGLPVILHPRVWKDEKDAEKASKDPVFRENEELVRQFEEKMSL